MMARSVRPEMLDGLAVDDPAAIRSRGDLQRIHRLMGTRRWLVQALRPHAGASPAGRPLRLLELGAGDGTLMLGVAARLKHSGPAVELTLLDRQPLLARATVEGFAAAGWTARPQVMDVLDWVAGPEPVRWDGIVANLFLHHFDGVPLASLLGAIASRSTLFFACEPRRARLALAGSHLVGLMGANAVTREDAVLSVHAGFAGREITALWPGQRPDWSLREYPAGLFSHCFWARRQAVGEADISP